MTASTGSWSGKALKYGYQWVRCDATGAGCSAIANATASTYLVGSTAVGYTLRVVVTASNKNGSAISTSGATAVVPSATAPAPPPPPPPPPPTTTPPTVTSPPTITGTPQQGQTLTASPGSWSGTTPMTFTYQWQRCDSGGGSCAPIAGASSTTYVLVSADVGKTERVSVTASNAAGSAAAASAPTSTIGALPTLGPTTCQAPVDPLTDHWYSCASTFNTPIPANPAIHPNSANFVSGIATDMSRAGYSPLSMPVYGDVTGYPTAATPLQTVRRNFPSCNYLSVPAPFTADLQPSQVGESHGILMAPDGSEWDFYKLTKPGVLPLTELAPGGGTLSCPVSNDWNAMIVAQHVPGWKGTGYDSADTMGFRATKIAAGAGLIRKIDMQMPAGSTWPHALSVMVANTSNGSVYPKFVTPARGGDGTDASGTISGGASIPEGARLQLDPSIDVDTWPSLASAPEWMRMAARTMQVYGLVVVDTGRQLDAEVNMSNWGGLAGFSTSNTHLPQDLVSHLRVIDWNKWTGP